MESKRHIGLFRLHSSKGRLDCDNYNSYYQFTKNRSRTVKAVVKRV